MSERKTLSEIVDRLNLTPTHLNILVGAISNELEAIRVIYEARVSYLENQNEIIQTRLAVLEARCG